MPRLINADKVRKKLVYFTCSTGIDEAPYEFASDIIDKEPTVEAIPIEWIEKQIKTVCDNIEAETFGKWLIKEWEKRK